LQCTFVSPFLNLFFVSLLWLILAASGISALFLTYLVPNINSVYPNYPAVLNNASITFDFTNNDYNLYPSLRISIAEYNPYTKVFVNLTGWVDQVVSTSAAYVTVAGVFPGRCMQVLAVPMMSTLNGSVWTPSLTFADPRVPVTCGCPTYSLAELTSVDPSGAPINVRASQVSF
jgi:hypothetical protein